MSLRTEHGDCLIVADSLHIIRPQYVKVLWQAQENPQMMPTAFVHSYFDCLYDIENGFHDHLPAPPEVTPGVEFLKKYKSQEESVITI